MRRTTALMHQWEAETQSGESLYFEKCKGGYFPTDEEYGIKFVGKTAQDGTPTPEAPVEIQCVKAGTIISVQDYNGNVVGSLIVPYNLFEGDIWYPVSGKIERDNVCMTFNGNENWRTYDDNVKRLQVSRRSKNGYGVASYSNHYPYGISLIDASITIQRMDSGGQYVYFTDRRNMSSWKEQLQIWHNNGTPLVLVYKANNKYVEQCESQLNWMPSGAVKITQSPTELTGTMSATVLVRR